MNPRPTASPDAAAAVMAEHFMDESGRIYSLGNIMEPSDESASPAELIARARLREDIGDDLHAKGLTEEAKWHWNIAARYRDDARKVA